MQSERGKLIEALEKIVHLSRPGQQIDIHAAIEILCDIHNAAKEGLKQP